MDGPPPAAVRAGSGRDAWLRFAMALAQANRMLGDTVEMQSRTIDDLEAELMRLRGRVPADPPGESVEGACRERSPAGHHPPGPARR